VMFASRDSFAISNLCGALKPSANPAFAGVPNLFLGRHDGAKIKGEVMKSIEDDATLAEVVRTHIIRTLAHCGGNRTQAAKTLNISLRGLRNKLREYAGAGIEVTRAQKQKSAGKSLRCDNSPAASSARA
jgi:transcriptional regulator with GAF, ATPase, and Fis domain